MSIILVALVSLVCLALFAVALTYLIMGTKSFVSGRKEKSRPKIIGGLNAIIISLVAIAGIFLLWRWLNSLLL